MPHPALNFPTISHHVLNSTKVFPWPYKTLYDLAPGHFFDLIPFHSHPCLLLFTNTGLVPFEHAKLVLVFDICPCCSLGVPLLMNLHGPLLSSSHRVEAQKIDTCWINEWSSDISIKWNTLKLLEKNKVECANMEWPLRYNVK